jgi:hypothetical protein
MRLLTAVSLVRVQQGEPKAFCRSAEGFIRTVFCFNQALAECRGEGLCIMLC